LIDTPATSRFVGVSRAAALAILAIVGAAIALCVFVPEPKVAPPPPNAVGDYVFYQRLVDRVRGGEDYDRAAVAELRAGHKAVGPFLAVRPPLLTEFLARLPDQRARDLCLSLLAAAVIAAWTIRLGGSPPQAALNLVILYLGVGICVTLQGPIDLLHEAWSGLLISLSLAVRGDRRFMASVAFGLLAALIRELAFPYLAIMSAFAFIEGKRAEAASFAAALGAAVIALIFHGLAVTPLYMPGDLGSPTWLTFTGLGLLLSELMWLLIGLTFGGVTAAIALPLALAGAAGRRDPLGLRLLAVLGGYALAFTLVGRPGGIHWGLMITPLIAVGLCLAPKTLRDLIRSALATRRAARLA
jgi:hypothetical protein